MAPLDSGTHLPAAEPEAAEAASIRESVDRLPSPRPGPAAFVSDELGRIRSAVQALSPADAAIGFDYDGLLRINIDVRSLEDLARLEILLPAAFDGMFFNIQRRLVEHHPFLHRLTATVAR